MDTSPTDISAEVNQGGGLFKAGQITIGQLGLGQGIYNSNGGTLMAANGLAVGCRATAS